MDKASFGSQFPVHIFWFQIPILEISHVWTWILQPRCPGCSHTLGTQSPSVWRRTQTQCYDPASGRQTWRSSGKPCKWAQGIWTVNSVYACLLSHFSSVWLFLTLRTVAHQVPLSMGILQARIVEWVAISFSRGSSWPRDQACIFYVSCFGRWVFTTRVTWEALWIL